MGEILLTRHAKSYANARDPAFGNVESPLDEKGIGQTVQLGATFSSDHDIVPKFYPRAVLASEYKRPQETARHAGFKYIRVSPIINESAIDRELLSGRQIITKHKEEGWVPPETRERAQKFLSLIRQGELEYQIFFTHGLFIASVLSELSAEAAARGEEPQHTFDEERGFIPLLATITPATV